MPLLLTYSRSTDHLKEKSPKYWGFKYIPMAIVLMKKLLKVSSVIGIFQYLNDLSEIYQYLSENFIKVLFTSETYIYAPGINLRICLAIL